MSATYSHTPNPDTPYFFPEREGVSHRKPTTATVIIRSGEDTIEVELDHVDAIETLGPHDELEVSGSIISKVIRKGDEQKEEPMSTLNGTLNGGSMTVTPSLIDGHAVIKIDGRRTTYSNGALERFSISEMRERLDQIAPQPDRKLTLNEKIAEHKALSEQLWEAGEEVPVTKGDTVIVRHSNGDEGVLTYEYREANLYGTPLPEARIRVLKKAEVPKPAWADSQYVLARDSDMSDLDERILYVNEGAGTWREPASGCTYRFDALRDVAVMKEEVSA